MKCAQMPLHHPIRWKDDHLLQPRHRNDGYASVLFYEVLPRGLEQQQAMREIQASLQLSRLQGPLMQALGLHVMIVTTAMPAYTSTRSFPVALSSSRPCAIARCACKSRLQGPLLQSSIHHAIIAMAAVASVLFYEVLPRGLEQQQAMREIQVRLLSPGSELQAALDVHIAAVRKT